MATNVKGLDSAALSEKISSQFRGLNPNDPASWPVVPKALLCTAVAAGIVAALWFVWLTNSADELEAEQKKEVGPASGLQKEARAGGQLGCAAQAA
jgi:type IV pilus assembly protein PilO